MIKLPKQIILKLSKLSTIVIIFMFGSGSLAASNPANLIQNDIEPFKQNVGEWNVSR